MTFDRSIGKKPRYETKGLQGGYWLDSLSNGTPILIRELSARDRQRDWDFFEALGKDTPHYRFLASFSTLEQTHDKLIHIRQPNRITYIALGYEGNILKEIGKARYCAVEGDAHCEFAVAVSKRWQRKGVATALMQHLMEIAKQKGFKKISSIDSSGNHPMDCLAKSMGFTGPEGNQHGTRIFYQHILQ